MNRNLIFAMFLGAVIALACSSFNASRPALAASPAQIEYARLELGASLDTSAVEKLNTPGGSGWDLVTIVDGGPMTAPSTSRFIAILRRLK